MKKDFSRNAFSVFFSYYRPHWKLFALDILMAVVGVAAELVFPYATRQALHTLLPEQKYTAFFTVMAILLGAYILRSLSVYIVTVFGHDLGVRVEADMRADIFRHVQDLSFSFFDRHRTGKLMSRMTTDLFEITELAHHGPENVLQASLTLIGAVVILTTIRWELALVLAVMLPVLLVLVIALRKKLRASSLAVKQETAEINAAVEGGVSGARTVKAFANESVEMDKFNESNERFKKSKRVYYRWFGLFNAVTEFTVASMQVAVFALGGFYIMRGRMDLADLVAFSLYVSIFTAPIRKLISFVEQFETGGAGFERFLEIMRTPAAVEDLPGAEELEGVRGGSRIPGRKFSLRRRPCRYRTRGSARRARRDAGAGRPFGQREDDAQSAPAPVLRRHGRRRSCRRPGYPFGDTGVAPKAHRHYPAGCVSVCRYRAGKHPLRQTRRHGRRGHGGGPPGRDP